MNAGAEDVIAERQLEFIGIGDSTEACRVVLHRPVQEGSDGPWFCSYSIEAQTFQRRSRAVGEDSLQSLILAQRVLVVELQAFAQERNGSFTWFGQTDLGL
jgi:hypothetical protein